MSEIETRERTLPPSLAESLERGAQLPAAWQRLERGRARPSRPKGRPKRADRPSPATAAAIASRPDLAHVATAGLFGLALSALELANAATSYWALDNLLGPAGALGLPFAGLLTIALGALDTGGLFRLFGPEADGERTFAVWSVMGAWLLCATANAVLTWWAVSSAMVERAAGNAVLSGAQLLNVTPAALAVSLWLIRILFVAGWAQGERG